MRYWAVSLLSLAIGLTTEPSWSVPDAMAPPSDASGGASPAQTNYNAGLAIIEKADRERALAETDAARREQAMQSATELYTEARRLFQEAANMDPAMPGAWNMLGYSQRKLGDYDAALASYGRALSLHPNFAEAIEYRGEAFLGLNRVADAKQAYLDLFAINRALSDQYLNAVKSWIDARRKSPSGVDAATLKQLDAWVKERSKIAATTAALTREAAAANWR